MKRTGIERDHALFLTPKELAALRDALQNIAIEMDDDGREGTFEASPLCTVLEKIEAVKEVK